MLGQVQTKLSANFTHWDGLQRQMHLAAIKLTSMDSVRASLSPDSPTECLWFDWRERGCSCPFLGESAADGEPVLQPSDQIDLLPLPGFRNRLLQACLIFFEPTLLK